MAAAEVEQSQTGVADIIVTAQRRAENMLDVPIAITAYSGEALVQKGLRDSRDIELSTPSLSIGNQFGAANSAVVNLRGQVQADNVITVDPSVGVYFDDVYLGRANGQITELFDVERVEVLKGPQGTLYGRNTTGGA
ncbi:outer membrane receptor protein involved in Fe transport [Sphingobium sp. OAS761]|uniref:TonB-dependent receptor plug domain-containing protein n=1 Tax=Sphingobium sp. OAS761 TaxID=2817901 RepID=UPI0020A0BC29|nr:outer membrane receptor protein involved in Fe transport [Sphingobium sp. OAS761]